MRLVRTLFLIFLAIILVVISIANSENVSLYLLPTDLSSLMGTTISINIPLFLVFFSGIFIGLIVGFVWEWIREMKHRSASNRKSRDLVRVENELNKLKRDTGQNEDEVLLLLNNNQSNQ